MPALTPDELDALPEYIAKIYRDLEDTLLEEICTRLKITGDINQVGLEDIKALRAMGINLKEIKKKIEAAAGIAQATLAAIFIDVEKRNTQYYGKMATIADITAPAVFFDKTEIEAIERQTRGQMSNFTGSMGFLVDNGQRKLPPADAYQWALDKAVSRVQSGGIAYGAAIYSSIRELCGSGLRVIDYESGHHDHADVAARRAVLTGVNQINNKYSEMAMNFLETDYVEVSAHAGARDIPGPKGWESHKDWQGKIYYWPKNKNSENKYNYPDFEKACGPGDVQGICGANCRHNYSPFIPDVMEPSYTETELANIDRPPFTYNGRQYTTYEATQKQRAIERAVRKHTRIADGYKAAGATEKYNAEIARIMRLRTEYNKFSKAAHLRTQEERMKVYTLP